MPGVQSNLNGTVADCNVYRKDAWVILNSATSECFIYDSCAHTGSTWWITENQQAFPWRHWRFSLKYSVMFVLLNWQLIAVYTLQHWIVKDLCADIILEKDFLKLHYSTFLKMGGQLYTLLLAQVHGVAPAFVAKFRSLQLFVGWVLTHSRRHMLNRGAIEPPESHWCVQMPIIMHERSQQEMFFHYLPTTDRFIALSSYPLSNIGEKINEMAHRQTFSTP